MRLSIKVVYHSQLLPKASKVLSQAPKSKTRKGKGFLRAEDHLKVKMTKISKICYSITIMFQAP